MSRKVTMARLFEWTQGDSPLDTWVRAVTLGALLMLCVALVSTTLLLRNPDRGPPPALLIGEDLTPLASPFPRSTP